MTEQPDFTDKSLYKLWLDEHVRFNDLDAFGHVKNMEFCSYYDTARMNLMQKVGITMGDDAKYYGALVRLENNFLAELHFPNKLKTGISILGVGKSSIKLASAVFCDNKCIANSFGILILMDKKTRKPTPVPEDMLEKMAEFRA